MQIALRMLIPQKSDPLPAVLALVKPTSMEMLLWRVAHALPVLMVVKRTVPQESEQMRAAALLSHVHLTK